MREQLIGAQLGVLSNLLKRQMAFQRAGAADCHVTGM